MNESLLVNTLGHSAGVLIFGIFLYLLIQDRAARRLPGGAKSMLAAALALLWNLASLIVLGCGPSGSLFLNITVTVGFSVLSLLPAVLFDLALPDRYRVLVRLGYALSAIAIAMHVAELFHEGGDYHRRSLGLITIGFGALTCMAAFGLIASREGNRRATTSRLVGTMALFLLAMSFVHLRSAHGTQIWSRELAFHHAAIPLAMLVLLQDYRFVMVDALLRFLANVFLAAIVHFRRVRSLASRLDSTPIDAFSRSIAAGGRVSFADRLRAAARSSASRPDASGVSPSGSQQTARASENTDSRRERLSAQSVPRNRAIHGRRSDSVRETALSIWAVPR